MLISNIKIDTIFVDGTPIEKQIANGFPNTYKRKYSLTGDGIYNLIQ